MQSIPLEYVSVPGNREENKRALEALKPFVGKKVVLVFKKPQETKRGNIRRYHCTIESLWERGINFSPVLAYRRTLHNEVWFADLKSVEIKS